MRNEYIEDISKWKVPIKQLHAKMNPFETSGVKLFVLAGQMTNYITIKAGMTYWMLDAAKRAGKLKGKKHIVVASSGATALSLAVLARDEHFGIPDAEIVAVIKSSVPDGKRLPVKYAGVKVIEPYQGLSGIETARALGRQEGWYVLDQYADDSNQNAYRDHLAPHIVSEMELFGELNLLVAGIGTGGTITGLNALKQTWNKLHSVGVMCMTDETIPGMRSAKQMSEISIPWREAADEIVKVKSLHAYIAALQIQDEAGMMMGISAGATYVAALMTLKRRLADGTLDELRGPDGVVRAMFVAHDGLRTYTANRLPEEVEAFLEKKDQPKIWELLGIKPS